MNQELEKIYREDIEDRKRENQYWDNPKINKEINRKDQERKTRVKQLIKKGLLKEAVDYHHAALIFQHGETSGDFKKAHELAKKALAMGDNTARWLFASTLDRYLLSKGKAQKFGTQFKQNEKGRWELAQPIDPKTTDKERTKYSVPPLKDALKVFKEKHG